MRNKTLALTVVMLLLLALAVPAFAAGPNFGEAIYADGQAWGTKGTADLPAPNAHNRQSFDGLYKITNGVEGQLAVAEAAPGNPAYNGGRWIEYMGSFTGTPVLVTSFGQLQDLIDAGEISFTETGNYFQCPLLPVKG